MYTVVYTIVQSAIYGRAVVYTIGARLGEKMTFQKVPNWREKKADLGRLYTDLLPKLSHLAPFLVENWINNFLPIRCENTHVKVQIWIAARVQRTRGVAI